MGQSPAVWLWPCDLKINRDHILSLEGITVSSLVTFHHRGHKIFRVENTWDQQFNLRKWTGKLKLKREHLLLDGNYCTKFGSFQAKRAKDIEHSTFGIETSSLTLTFNHMAWKSIGVITSLGVISVLNMSNYKKKNEDQQFDLWPLDMKSNREQLISKGKSCNNFCNFQAGRSL